MLKKAGFLDKKPPETAGKMRKTAGGGIRGKFRKRTEKAAGQWVAKRSGVKEIAKDGLLGVRRQSPEGSEMVSKGPRGHLRRGPRRSPGTLKTVSGNFEDRTGNYRRRTTVAKGAVSRTGREQREMLISSPVS